MTEPARRPRRPSPAPVIWGSVVLFAVLFALLTHRLSADEAASRPVVVRKVLEHRVVTTIVPTPGPESVSSSGAPAVEEVAAPEAEPVITSSS